MLLEKNAENILLVLKVSRIGLPTAFFPFQVLSDDDIGEVLYIPFIIECPKCRSWGIGDFFRLTLSQVSKRKSPAKIIRGAYPFI